MNVKEVSKILCVNCAIDKPLNFYANRLAFERYAWFFFCHVFKMPKSL